MTSRESTKTLNFNTHSPINSPRRVEKRTSKKTESNKKLVTGNQDVHIIDEDLTVMLQPSAGIDLEGVPSTVAPSEKNRRSGKLLRNTVYSHTGREEKDPEKIIIDRIRNCLVYSNKEFATQTDSALKPESDNTFKTMCATDDKTGIVDMNKMD